METISVSKLIFLSIFLGFFQLINSAKISYDNKGIIINGQRKLLISGSIHYPRSTPDMWEDLIAKAKHGGLDVIDTYVFWNGHEPSPGKYHFEGRYDLVRFIKTVHRAGLYVNLRIGPYVCAEWNFGGFPVWLKYVPGISFRTDNEPFKRAMQGFTEKIVDMMKKENLFASQGGPIIMSQIENEYGSEEKEFGAAGKSYIDWAANMANGLKTGVPWLMCKQDDAPDSMINTCNGFYCDYFKPNKPNKPKMWTEAWSGWFTEFGGPVHERPVEDLAFAVARFIQSGGSFINYYMYHGGTNFERTAGGPFITTSYDYDAPIDEYGLIRQPKYGHLKDLHRALKLSEQALLSSEPEVSSLGTYHQAFVFKGQGACAAFLSNFHFTSSARVKFNNEHYDLPAWSISILPDCKHVVFNTARVGVQTSHTQMIPANSLLLSWKIYDEDLSSLEETPTMTAPGLLEQINITRDSSDYLWYMTSVHVSPSDLHGVPSLMVESAGHALHVFVNGKFAGSAYGTREDRKLTFKGPVNLHSGNNRITLLSVAVGLPNVGPHYESWKTGVLGPVVLNGLRSGKRDLTWQKWSYQVGLKGENMQLTSPNGASSNEWMHASLAAQNTQPLTWYKLVCRRSMDDIFTRILDLTSYLSSPLLHLLEDLYCGIFNGHLESFVALCAVEYSSSAGFHERRSTFGECSSSSKHNVATYRGLQRRALNVKEPSCVNTSTETDTEKGQTHGGMPLVFGGLTLLLYGLRVFHRLALASWRCFLGYYRFTIEQVKRNISRVNKGLRGSSDDIGWLQRTPGLPPVTDGTTRFLEVLQDVRNGNHMLPDSFVYLLIPGLFSNHGPLYFVSTKRYFSKMGLACHIAKIHSEASVENNACVLKQYIEELYWGSGKRVMLLGHSKGGVDAAAALSKYWKDLQGKVAGLALVQSPYGGTPIASDALREGQVADKKARRVIELLISILVKGDFQALEDLTYEKRKKFVLSHKLPKEIPLISFHSEASIAPHVLATLTQIDHAELPWFPFPTATGARKVPVMIPVSATMAITALLLKLRYGEKSDGLVTCRDAEVPGSVVIRPDKKLDHAWIAYSSWKKNPSEPDCCEMCEAILTLLVELGEKKKAD